jgi:DNA-binding GntR family transcriptional regulator
MPKVADLESEDKKLYKKNTMRKDIRKYIQNLITKGVYKPGDRIVETKLAKDLGVSQAPVREAILELVMMGLLEERPYSGTFVKKQMPEDIEDIYTTRALIEQCAARYAAVKITEEKLAELSNELEIMKKAAEAGDIELFVEADVRFHGGVVNAAESKSLKRIWYFLRMADWTYTTTQLTKHSLFELCSMHEIIYKHLKSRNMLSAGAAMYLHIMEFAGEVVNNMQEAEDKQPSV